MALFKWEVFPPEDVDPRWLELQKKDGTPFSWTLYAQVNETGMVAFVGKIEKPLDEERYYLDYAPPSAAELAREKRQEADGLSACYQYTLQFRADHAPCASYENLGKAKRVLVERICRRERDLLSQAQTRLQYVLQAMETLDNELEQELFLEMEKSPNVPV